MAGLKKRSLRIPVRYVDGRWECALGGVVPVAEGTEAELVVERQAIVDKAFLQTLDRPTRHRVLGEGAKLLVRVTVKPEKPLPPDLQRYLIRYRDLRHQLDTQFLDVWSPATLSFVEVTLVKPDPARRRKSTPEDGGLWLVTQGMATTGIASPAIRIPPLEPSGAATSLNHALTRLSEAYEAWRISHTGNVYTNVLYQAARGTWHTLEVLRQGVLRDQEAALGGELWDDFMRKMTDRRDAGTRR